LTKPTLSYLKAPRCVSQLRPFNQ